MAQYLSNKRKSERTYLLLLFQELVVDIAVAMSFRHVDLP